MAKEIKKEEIKEFHLNFDRGIQSEEDFEKLHKALTAIGLKGGIFIFDKIGCVTCGCSREIKLELIYQAECEKELLEQRKKIVAARWLEGEEPTASHKEGSQTYFG